MGASASGRTPRRFPQASVLVSFTANARPQAAAADCSDRTRSTAVSQSGSPAKASSGTSTSKPRVWFSRPRTASGPSSVGFSFTVVCRPRSASRKRAMRSISPGGQPCMVERVTLSASWPGSGISSAPGHTAAARAQRAASSSREPTVMRSRKPCTAALRTPSRSYPTLRSMTNPGVSGSSAPAARCSRRMATQASRYWSALAAMGSSWDHSQL